MKSWHGNSQGWPGYCQGLKSWGPLETDPREIAEGHKLGCFLSVAGVMLGGGGAGSYH